jgi:predicted ATPase
MEAERIGAERGLPTFEIMGKALQGVALVRAGKSELAVPVLQNAIEQWHGTGARLWGRYIRAVLAEALARSGEVKKGLDLCDPVLAEIEQPDCAERSHYPEILRLKGWMLSLLGDVDAAERIYANSLAAGRRQRAKSWELRTATSYARLMQSKGRSKEGYDLLAPIYGWFTEGHDTIDLKEAKFLLDQLS